MREPLFTHRNTKALEEVDAEDPASLVHARLKAALHRAISLSIESAFRFGVDFPVGAVALQGSEIAGRGFANDTRFRQRSLHAEMMALLDTQFSFGVITATPAADTVVVSLEPCDSCQDQLAQVPGLKQVAFGLCRKDLEERGLVRQHKDDIFARAERENLPYEVVQIDDPDLRKAGLTVFDHVSRNPVDGIVSVDVNALNDALVALNNR